MTFIYHIAAAADWEQARRDGQYTMSTRGRTLAQEGFIHTSTAAQVALVANSFYRDAPDLVLLVIDPDRVTPEIRYEHVPGQDLPYPAHLRAAECRRGRGDPPVPGTTTTITAASKPRAGSCGGLRLPGTGRQPILASVASDFTDPVEWGLANSAGAVLGRAADMRADRRFRKSGRVQCGLRVIDGHQPGLAGRWRVGVASFSPRRLDFRRRW